MYMDFKKFFSFNSNSAFKLLEISYYGVLALIFTLVATIILENESIIPFLFKTYNYENFPIYVILEDIGGSKTIWRALLLKESPPIALLE